jgi:hypothetical protein
MNQFVTKLMTVLQQFGGRRCSPQQTRRFCLRLEAMEDRMLPSTAAPALALAAAPAALTGPIAMHADGTGGQPVATPDRPVHGYKWRRPWPWEVTSGESTQVALKTFVVDQPFPTPPAQANHLSVGGSDGLQVLTSTDGHVVVHPPDGPASTEIVSSLL